METRSPSEEALNLILDFARLRDTALATAARLGNDAWSDFGTHDPGVTLLEALCFSVHDLGYRYSHRLEDLLEPERETRSGLMFTARRILPAHPITRADLRRLLLDVPGVKNAWVEPAGELLQIQKADATTAETSVTLKGLHLVQLELDRDSEGHSLENLSAELTVTMGTETQLFDVSYPAWSNWSAAADSRPLWQLSPDHLSNVQLLCTLDWVADSGAFVLHVSLQPPGKQAYQATAQIEPRQQLTEASAWKSAVMAKLQTELSSAYLPRLRASLAVVRRVMHTCRRHRNLGEEFAPPRAVQYTDIGVCAEIDVRDDADIEDIAAQFFGKMSTLWTPSSPFQSLSELLVRGVPVEAIFDGPALQRGVIIDNGDDVSSRGRSVHASDVERLLMETEGVHAVRNLVLAAHMPDGSSETKILGSFNVPSVPRFVAARSRLFFYKKGIPYQARADELQAKMSLYAELRGGEAATAAMESDIPLPVGVKRAFDEYVSLRHDLPAIYGTRRHSKTLLDNRQDARIKQLRGFLLLFEQLLANYVAQLARAPRLFGDVCNTTGEADTYFRMSPGDPDELKLWLDQSGASTCPGGDPQAEGDAIRSERQLQFLDHALAKFNIPAAAFPMDASNYDLPVQNRRKRDFLASYPALSKRRSRAAVYLRRLRSLVLPGGNWGPPLLIEHIQLRPRASDSDAPKLGENACKDPYSYRATLVLPGDVAPFSDPEQRARIERVAREEAPAHVLLRICWPDGPTFSSMATAYKTWRDAVASGIAPKEGPARLALVARLNQMRSWYPQAVLNDPKHTEGSEPTTRLGFASLS